jgi:hypothetical protein
MRGDAKATGLGQYPHFPVSRQSWSNLVRRTRIGAPKGSLPRIACFSQRDVNASRKSIEKKIAEIAEADDGGLAGPS